MRPLITFLKLYKPWLLILNFITLWLLTSAGSIVLLFGIKLLLFPALYILANPFLKKYHYYFLNQSLNPLKLFVQICLLDLVFTTLFYMFLKIVFYA